MRVWADRQARAVVYLRSWFVRWTWFKRSVVRDRGRPKLLPEAAEAHFKPPLKQKRATFTRKQRVMKLERASERGRESRLLL